jgi:hypothetical protein
MTLLISGSVASSVVAAGGGASGSVRILRLKLILRVLDRPNGRGIVSPASQPLPRRTSQSR